jgi:hypothetical protein
VSTPTPVEGVLVLYHFIPPYAETVLEHALAFERHSRFPVWSLNTAERFPAALEDLDFRVVVLHYSLFGSADYRLDASYRDWLGRHEGLTVAFFQDEYQHTAQRFAFIDNHRVDWVYTLLGPEPAAAVYGTRTRGPRLFTTIPGFVGDDLLGHAAAFARPDAERTIDIGYRARTLPFATGRGGREKSEIGREFASRAADRGLRLDIGVDEADRLYGDAWYRFLGSCRAVLGVEAGVSVFDLDDRATPAVAAYLGAHPAAAFEEVEREVLAPFEEAIPYRTISPRHFEAAAFGTCQILFEGEYSGLMEAGTHFIALRKDFANLDEVVATFRDEAARARIVAAARRDLVDSGRHTYRSFVAGFDEELERAGIAVPAGGRARAIDRTLARGARLRRAERRLRTAYWRARVGARRARRSA